MIFYRRAWRTRIKVEGQQVVQFVQPRVAGVCHSTSCIIVVLVFFYFYPCLLLYSIIYSSILLTVFRLSHYFIVVYCSFLVYFALLPCYSPCSLMISSLYLLGFVALEPKVFQKLSLYLREVVVRSTYIIPFPDLIYMISLSVLLYMKSPLVQC